LPDLVRLGLPANRLQVDQLRDVEMREDMVAAVDATQLEAQRFGKSAEVANATLATSPRAASRLRSLRSSMTGPYSRLGMALARGIGLPPQYRK
jgi:hypothetical protein